MSRRRRGRRFERIEVVRVCLVDKLNANVISVARMRLVFIRGRGVDRSNGGREIDEDDKLVLGSRPSFRSRSLPRHHSPPVSLSPRPWPMFNPAQPSATDLARLRIAVFAERLSPSRTKSRLPLPFCKFLHPFSPSIYFVSYEILTLLLYN